MSDQSVLDKSMRSVFVGNIPYGATEEKLKEIFNEVGPVVSFRLVYDKETGKPKGYGFCEYKDQETAHSAMRNLNGREIGGRTLRIDNACTEKSRLEMQSLMMAMPTSESCYGKAVSPEKAPEAISNAVASLPPEQMYELMKQMKAYIQNNPVEARNMLLQNPQLSYALLQTQVILKIVDPQVAASMLQSANQVPPTLVPITPAAPTTTMNPMPHIPINGNSLWVQSKNSIPPMVQQQPHVEDVDLRQMRRVLAMDQQVLVSRDPRAPTSMDSDIRTYSVRDPRKKSNNITATTVPASVPQIPTQVVQPAWPQVQLPPNSASSTDNENAALIMQVLHLTDEHIAKLPAEQRQSILALKEKIAKSAQQ